MVGEGGDALGADRMTLDIEEAPLAAGAVDGLGDGQMAGLVGVIEREISMTGSEFMADSGTAPPVSYRRPSRAMPLRAVRPEADGTRDSQCAGGAGAGDAYFGISALTPWT